MRAPDASEQARIFDLRLPALTLEAGGRVERHVVRGWWWGPVADRPILAERTNLIAPGIAEASAYQVQRRTPRDLDAIEPKQSGTAPGFDDTIPTVLLVHALTGDMRPGGAGGWWESVIGPGRALDPGKLRLLCFNNLGSCYGTSGPADERFPMRDGNRPAVVTTWDQARSIVAALDALGIGKVALATGGSLGGMIVLCLAALDPERFERIAPIATCEAASAWVIGWNHIGREAVRLDPGFPESADRGLEIARQLAMLTYRAEPGLDQRQGRAMAGAAGWTPAVPYRVETYLEHQGQKLRRRFHPLAYLAQLDAMDHHDLGREPGSGRSDAGSSWGLDRIRASTLAVDIRTDQLFFPEQMKKLAARLRQRDVRVEEFTIDSPHGHDSFLIESDQVTVMLGRALALPAASGDNAAPVWPGARAAR